MFLLKRHETWEICVKKLTLNTINLIQEEPPKEEEVIPVDTMEEYNEIDESNPETQDAFAAYLAEGSQKDREVCVTQPAVILIVQMENLQTTESSAFQVVFCRELGVAIEKIKDGFTLESLWSVLPPEPNKKALLE